MKLQPNDCIVASSKSRMSLAIRWAGIGWGLITFIWLPFEDTTTIFLLLLSAGWCTWFAAWLIQRTAAQTKPNIYLIIGVLGGLLVFPSALVLTLLKAGLHDHGFLDFTTTQLKNLARLTPVWAIVGLVISAGYHYLRSHPPT